MKVLSPLLQKKLLNQLEPSKKSKQKLTEAKSIFSVTGIGLYSLLARKLEYEVTRSKSHKKEAERKIYSCKARCSFRHSNSGDPFSKCISCTLCSDEICLA